MRVAYFDCPMGASGDMILGALIDGGLDGRRLVKALAALNLPGYKLRWERVLKGPLDATQATVEVEAGVPERRMSNAEAVLNASDMPQDVLQGSLTVLQRLAEAQTSARGFVPAQVPSSDVWTLETLVLVVGSLWGLNMLGVERVYASPLPAARGWGESEKGPLPLPRPATLALLQDVALSPAPVEGELVTQTGAALLTHLARDFGPPPPMTLRTVGCGAGRKDYSHPNVLRLWLGEIEGGAELERLVLLETGIDNMNPQLYEHVSQQLLDAGARDVMLVPAQMKSSRPGMVLSVLCRPEQMDRLSDILFLQTSTLGVCRTLLTRQTLPRRFERVRTSYGVVQVKVATLPDGSERAIPEYEDCRRLAQEAKVPLIRVLEEVRRLI